MNTNILNKLKGAAILIIASFIGLTSCSTDSDSMVDKIQSDKVIMKIRVQESRRV